MNTFVVLLNDGGFADSPTVIKTVSDDRFNTSDEVKTFIVNQVAMPSDVRPNEILFSKGKLKLCDLHYYTFEVFSIDEFIEMHFDV